MQLKDPLALPTHTHTHTHRHTQSLIWKKPTGHTNLWLKEIIIVQIDIQLAGQEPVSSPSQSCFSWVLLISVDEAKQDLEVNMKELCYNMRYIIFGDIR